MGLGDIFKWGRRIFIFVKGLILFYMAVRCSQRYEKTFGTWFQFEVGIFLGIIVLDLTLWGFEFAAHDLNLIFAIFIVNSVMKMLSAYRIQREYLDSILATGHTLK